MGSSRSAVTTFDYCHVFVFRPISSFLIKVRLGYFGAYCMWVKMLVYYHYLFLFELNELFVFRYASDELISMLFWYSKLN